MGIEVTARWYNETVPHTVQMADLPDAYHQETALVDVEDILNADVFVLFTADEADYTEIPVAALARGGRHFEAGFAFAAGKELILCGKRENVFHHLPDVTQFDTWTEVKEYLTLKKVNEYQAVEVAIFG